MVLRRFLGLDLCFYDCTVNAVFLNVVWMKFAGWLQFFARAFASCFVVYSMFVASNFACCLCCLFRRVIVGCCFGFIVVLLFTCRVYCILDLLWLFDSVLFKCFVIVFFF